MMNYVYALLGFLTPLPETLLEPLAETQAAPLTETLLEPLPLPENLPDMGGEISTLPQQVASGTSFSYLQIIFYLLCFVVVLFLASKVARWLGRKAGGRTGSHLRLVETLYLGPNRAVHLIMVGKQLFLVGAADRQLTLLAEMNDADLLSTLQDEHTQTAVGRQLHGKGFADYLKGLLDGGLKEQSSTNQQGVVSSTQRVEERLMKYRTHRGLKRDE